MSAYNYSDLTGAAILNTLGLASIGRYSESDIDFDKTQNGQYGSIPGDCLRDFESWAAFAGLDTTAFTSVQAAHYNTALVYYIASRYQELSNTSGAEPCKDSELKQVDVYRTNACKFLSNLSTKMKGYAGFCTTTALDSDLFTVKGYDPNCEVWQE